MADNHYGQLVTAKQDQREEARLKGKVRQGDNLRKKIFWRNGEFWFVRLKGLKGKVGQQGQLEKKIFWRNGDFRIVRLKGLKSISQARGQIEKQKNFAGMWNSELWVEKGNSGKQTIWKIKSFGEMWNSELWKYFALHQRKKLPSPRTETPVQNLKKNHEIEGSLKLLSP